MGRSVLERLWFGPPGDAINCVSTPVIASLLPIIASAQFIPSLLFRIGKATAGENPEDFNVYRNHDEIMDATPAGVECRMMHLFSINMGYRWYPDLLSSFYLLFTTGICVWASRFRNIRGLPHAGGAIHRVSTGRAGTGSKNFVIILHSPSRYRILQKDFGASNNRSRGIIFIVFPIQRIMNNIFSCIYQSFIITNNAVMKSRLPEKFVCYLSDFKCCTSFVPAQNPG